ncbi:hypothetical protein CN553_30635 [Bacillus cereus]|uniref:Uncharacterized protein n=1 Tax=Bacillus cereus TaxID=1396 RepID=A0A9X6U5Z8_BACCE|nr:hypothetical protein [Bacillus cereus]PEN79386.1 hypothetical protein CN553_30635 [Bacillus cereus]
MDTVSYKGAIYQATELVLGGEIPDRYDRGWKEIGKDTSQIKEKPVVKDGITRNNGKEKEQKLVNKELRDILAKKEGDTSQVKDKRRLVKVLVKK